jgi:hypothetical protein
MQRISRERKGLISLASVPRAETELFSCTGKRFVFRIYAADFEGEEGVDLSRISVPTISKK